MNSYYNLKQYLTNSLRAAGLATCFLVGCDDSPVCEQYNETTVLVNQPTTGKVEDAEGLISMVSVGSVTPAILDLVNESHALSSAPLPEQTYVTFVDNGCGAREGYSALAYAVPKETEGEQRGVYLLKERIFPRDLAILFHEIGHLQECGNGLEAIAVLNHLEQTAMSFGLLYQEQGEGEPIVDSFGYASPFYYESLLEAERMALVHQSDYFLGLIASVHYLLQHEGDFSLARERFVKSREGAEAECYSVENLLQEVRPYYKDVISIAELDHASEKQLRLAALRQFWPTMRDAYRVMANSIEAKFGGEAAEYWGQFVEEKEFPDIGLL